jgi:hypothetical protein
MREIFDFAIEEIRPSERNVFGALGLGPGQEPSEKIADLVVQATELFVDLVEPRGMFETITLEEFDAIYPGDGLNEGRTPLERIYPEADHMGLFVLTLGKSVSREIEGRFGSNDFAIAYTLDAIASTAAECAADRLEERFDALVLGDVASYYATAHLRYSPGYCGWHISGQKKLFERLGPGAIGVTLNKSCLMQPLKSVSGVIVSGKAEIHFFNNSFSFCSECTTKTCRDRLKHIMTIQKGSN